MAVHRGGSWLSLGLLLVFGIWVEALAFLPTLDGSAFHLGIPDQLSTPCQTAFNQTTQCNATLGAVAFNGFFPSSDQLTLICTKDCLESLENVRSKQVESCSTESYTVDGKAVPATYDVDRLLFTYNYTCLRDGITKDFCAPLVDEWSQNEEPTSNQSCSDCMLHTFQVELNSPFGYDSEFASYYTSLTSSCGVTDYPIISPTPYTVSRTATTTSPSASASESCASRYNAKEGDDCLSVSKSQRVSTAMLRFQNGIAADCSNFPEAGTSLCIPESCEPYTLLANETCRGISEAHNASFTMTQLISWNPDINRDCSNLEALTGTQLCISAPGDSTEPDVASATSTTVGPVPAPTNVVDGTNLRCGKYYQVALGDTCASISVTMGISLRDFYFLVSTTRDCFSPVANSADAGARIPRSIATVPIYWPDTPTASRRLAISQPIPDTVPPSCLATSVSTASDWTFPSFTTTKATKPTPLPLAPGTLSNCSEYAEYITARQKSSAINACNVVASFYDVADTKRTADVDDFVSWNPSLSYDAKHWLDCQLKPGYLYCAHPALPKAATTSMSTSSASMTATMSSFSKGAASSASTTSATPPSRTGSNGEPTPLPIQAGMTSACGGFYLVKPGDGCYDIASANEIALADLYSWNPALKGDCSGLYYGYYICIGLLSRTATSS
ncbi:hypothetical protein CDD83_6595 [Cordyceps sp. RAO-2017]|nr:hypothetical protein CDD83_6595 [Cordyceps sp. RAO-2017]